MTGARLDDAVRPFDEVYRDHADAVYRFCLSQLRDPDVAEDVTGDVFAAAFAAYGRVRPDAVGVRTWLFRIARNAVIDQYRRDGRRRSLLARLGRDREFPDSVEENVQQRFDLASICTAMETLRERDRQLVGLRVAGGLTFAEVGQVLGMRESAAKMATHRALERVRSRLREMA
ncbi:MAG: sigma-70 family RNA polymerase sigma factor [Candidatus Dormibacteraeota bacterium]|nr:sigma-70 family RNA polymerase sigma factor [Candidatus Dormibacteraeota bacterium]